MQQKMPSLKVPDAGLLLEGPSGGSPDDGFTMPTQAFALTLGDSVIEDLIRCVENGEDIQLSLGGSPSFRAGTRVHKIPQTPEPFSFDLFLSRPFNSTRKAERLPATMSILKKPPNFPKTTASKPRAEKSERPTASLKNKPRKELQASHSDVEPTSDLDSNMKALKDSLAQAEAQRHQAVHIDGLAVGQKSGKKTGKNKSKLLSTIGYKSATNRSLPPSPALKSVGGSPSPTPVLSGSQQIVERAKEQRVALVHELAVEERTFDYLKQKWVGRVEDLTTALKKIADFNDSTGKWSMVKNYWKELDVWNYDYDANEDRDKAIDNAIRQYDKLRYATTQPEWERLLPVDDRGKGIILSRLQVNLTRGVMPVPAPKIKVQKAEETTDSSKDDSPPRGEAMARSTSNPLPSKAKKVGGREKLLPTAKPKASAAPAKTSPGRGKSQAKTNGGRPPLSDEFVHDSDSDSEAEPLSKTIPKPKPTQTQTQTAKVPAAAPKPKPVAKLPVKTQATKRRRDDEKADDDSSSSGSTPLSKRLKTKPGPITAPPAAAKHRPSDASQNSRGTSSGFSFKSKNTSPAKSSPLASSPPTNASDLDQPEPTPASNPGKKRPLDRGRNSESKRSRTDVSSDLLKKARMFKLYYEAYESLHREVSVLDFPPPDKMSDLLEMQERLTFMKTEIYRECPPSAA